MQPGRAFDGADVHGGALPSGATGQDAETTAVYVYLARAVSRARGRGAKVRSLVLVDSISTLVMIEAGGEEGGVTAGSANDAPAAAAREDCGTLQ